MDAVATANAYKTQQIMTASPEELTLMLYNGAIRFVGESMQALEKGDLEKSNISNLKAQDIIREFMSTLNMQYEISHELMSLYDYLEYRLIQANVQKDRDMLNEAKDMLIGLRDSWYQAMRTVKPNRAAVAK